MTKDTIYLYVIVKYFPKHSLFFRNKFQVVQMHGVLQKNDQNFELIGLNNYTGYFGSF